MNGKQPPAPPPVPEPDGIDLFGDDDDERTELATPDLGSSTPAQAPGGAISLDEEDEERTQIEKKPGPPR